MMNPCDFFKCLADETRLKSLLLIAQANEACVCDLMAALALDQPKISRHLAQLRKCGILIDERRGKWVFYKLHPALPKWAKDVIIKSAENNSSYFKSSLQKLNASQSSATACK
jgi:ArsR family transcriptional regulator, arsenate/arsenite/antimonite-responsive transcriptional repressor